MQSLYNGYWCDILNLTWKAFVVNSVVKLEEHAVNFTKYINVFKQMPSLTETVSYIESDDETIVSDL